jgi:acetate kinase
MDTTMGFTPLEGMMMATRSGSIDPGLILFLLREQNIGPGDLETALHERSGLLGVSGISSDLRDVLAAAEGGSARARLAYGLFIHSARRAIGAMTASLGGIDALAFTGGVGEHSSRVRSDVSRAMGYAGVQLDEAANARATGATGDADVSQRLSAAVLVVRAREDLAILAEIRRALG